MAFDWKEYLNLAEELSKRSGDEAAQRTSVSRAYYFAYHIASERAILNGYLGEISHRKIWGVYHEDENKEARRLSTRGTLMKKLREDADYDPSRRFRDDEVAQQLSNAIAFAQQLAALPADSPIVIDKSC